MITRFGEPGAVLLIRGEPGIGKSRLLARIIEEAVRLGFRTSCGSAAELGRPVPFGALAAVPADAVVPVPRHPVGGEGAYRVVESLVAAVSARAAAGPVLIAVDDHPNGGSAGAGHDVGAGGWFHREVYCGWSGGAAPTSAVWGREAGGTSAEDEVGGMTTILQRVAARVGPASGR
ncbi:hypothetical protein AB0I91_43465 [Actinosynnema sp. NPDC049800]